MNILFLSIGGLNNINDQSIYTDLIKVFRDNGHNVYVVSPRERRQNLPTEYRNEYGINILRIRIGNITKTSLIEKGISTIMLESLFINGIKKYLNNVKFDIVIYSTPPITFGKVVKYIIKRDNAKTYLLLKDIFPQNAVDLKMFSKRNPIYWFFRKKEKDLYRYSDFIGCMSEANVEYILKNNPEIDPSKVEVCPNSIDPKEIANDDEQIKKIRRKYNIPTDKTVFIYGGNLGKPQGIDFIIECLKANKNNDKVYFMIVGSGTEFYKLKSFFDVENINNAQLLSQLPNNEYEEMVSACDVGLIFLDDRFTIPNFPSRLLSYMQASIPVLAATDVNTDIWKVIEKGNFGFWCESNNIEEFNKQINKFNDKDLCKQLGKNARKYLEEHYTVKHSYEIIIKHFE